MLRTERQVSFTTLTALCFKINLFALATDAMFETPNDPRANDVSEVR